jgi:hypothetical protein
MDCGPADGPAVNFTATSDQPLSVIATFVVGDRLVATSEPFALGSEPWQGLLPLVLEPSEYDIGRGELRIHAVEEDEVLASRAVGLRLVGVSCG